MPPNRIVGRSRCGRLICARSFDEKPFHNLSGSCGSDRTMLTFSVLAGRFITRNAVPVFDVANTRATRMFIGCVHQLVFDQRMVGDCSAIVEVGHGYHKVAKQTAFEANQWQNAGNATVFVSCYKVVALVAKGFMNQIAPFGPMVD